MTIAKMYIDAMKAKAVGYLIIARIAAYMTALYAVKALAFDFNAEAMAEEFMDRIIKDERSRYIIADNIVFTVAKHRYLTTGHDEIGFDQRLNAARMRFNMSVDEGTFVEDYMYEYNKVEKPITKFVMDNINIVDRIKEAEDLKEGAVIAAAVIGRLIRVIENDGDISQESAEVIIGNSVTL